MKNLKNTETVEIYTADDLQIFRNRVNGYDGLESNLNAVLMSDIDISEKDADGNQISWTPIGAGIWHDDIHYNYYEAFYDGFFDGNGHTISGLYINKTEKIQETERERRNKGKCDKAGLFGVLRGSVKNLTVEGFVRNHTGAVTGGLCAAYVPRSPNQSIENCINRCTVDGISMTAGIAGFMNNKCSIKRCFNEGNITGNGQYTAGIVGYCEKDYERDIYELVTGCVNTGNISVIEGVPAFDDIASNKFRYNQIGPSFCLGHDNKQDGKVIFPFQNSLTSMYLRYSYTDYPNVPQSIFNHQLKEIKEMLAHDPNPEYVNELGQTYLHLICLKPQLRSLEQLKLLIQMLATETNIDFETKDIHGKTAADYVTYTSAKNLITQIAHEQAALKHEFEDTSFSTFGF